MPTIRLTIEYNGQRFSGWQEQPGQRTIQAELHKALELITREKIAEVAASGRTDAGVHAHAQVVHFAMQGQPDLERIRRGVSGIMRHELAVLDAEIVPDTFHARFSAKRKTYRYTILNREAPPVLDRGHVWFVRAPLDVAAMTRAAKALEGSHDFKSFQGAGCEARQSVREIYSSVLTHEAPYLRYEVCGSGFLKQMVRNIVGTLVEIGKGSLKLGSIEELLAAKDRTKAGPTAPAHGLCLVGVEY